MAVDKNMGGPPLEKVKKELQVLLKEFVLNLTVKCNKTAVDYLDTKLIKRNIKTISKNRKYITVQSQSIITFQISSKKFHLQSKHDFQPTCQTKQFCVLR